MDRNLTIKQLYKPVIRKFNRRKIITKEPFDILGVDLADYSKAEPKGYICVMIDYYTRFMWTYLMTNKDKFRFEQVFDDHFNKFPHIPTFIHSDKEPALINNRILEMYNISVYHTEFMGSPIVERSIRTLKEIIGKLMTLKKQDLKDVGRHEQIEWYHYVQQATEIYNTRKQKTIKMLPLQALNGVLSENPLVLEQLKEVNTTEHYTPKNPKYKVGDIVIIAKSKKIFDKNDKPLWNETKYRIDKVLVFNVPVFTLSNGKNYYEQEIQKII